VTRKKVGDLQTLRIKGALIIKYPHDLERAEIPVWDFKGPLKVSLGGVTLTLKSVTASGGDWGHETGNVSWLEGTPEQLFRDWFETAEGRLYGDCCAFMVGGNHNRGAVKTLRGKENILPSKFVIARLIGEDAVSAPFELDTIPCR
jgi:hypothetical protein